MKIIPCLILSLLNSLSIIDSKHKQIKNQYYKLKICNSISILELTINQFHNHLKNKRLFISQLIDCYLNRINQLDPYFHSIIQLNPEAKKEAQLKDNLLKEKDFNELLDQFPLFGVPILLKDNIATKDLNTTAGTKVLQDQVPIEDATLVKRLKQAGAIILGKNNLSLLSEVPSDLKNGWSPIGGQAINPYIFEANPLGSSTGSAVSMTLNLALVSIGTDTHGSIGGPAGREGVIGFKPTAGIVPRKGVVPFSVSHDSVGPICRTIMDAAQVLNVIAGPEEEDDYDFLTKNYIKVNYTDVDSNLEGIKIGIDQKMYDQFDQDQLSVLNETIHILKQFNAEIIYLKEDILIGEDNTHHGELDDSEFIPGIEAYLNMTKGPISTYKEFKEKIEVPEAKEKFKEIETLDFKVGDNLYIKYYKENYDYFAKDGILRIIYKYQLDLLITQFGRPSNKVGFPILSFPFRMDLDGLPIKGPAFTTSPLNEKVLFKVGLALDEKMERPIPEFKPCCTKHNFDE